MGFEMYMLYYILIVCDKIGPGCMLFLGRTGQLVSASSQNTIRLAIVFSVSIDLLPHFSSSDSETLHFSLENLVSSIDLCIHTRVLVHVHVCIIILQNYALYILLWSHMCVCMFWQVVPCLCRASRSEQQDVVSSHSLSVLRSFLWVVILPMCVKQSNEFATVRRRYSYQKTRMTQWISLSYIKIKCLTLSSLQSNTENIEVQTVPLSSSETAFGAPSELVIANRRKWIIQCMDATERTLDDMAQ